MKNVLNKIDKKILEQLVGRINIQKIREIVGKETNIGLTDIALAFFEDRILENAEIRTEVIKTLPRTTLMELSSKYYGKTFPTDTSTAIQLGSIPWAINSPFAIELLDILGLNYNYLPRRTRRFSTIERVKPIGKYYELFSYQNEVKDKILEKISKRERRFIVQMPTGSGKTKTAMEALLEYNEKNGVFERNKSLLWIAHTEELCEQAIETLSTIWTQTQVETLDIVRLYGNYDPTGEELQGSFVFSSYQKLCSKNSSGYLEVLRNICDVIIIDEAHKALARTYKRMLETLTSKDSILVGLTATPGRSSKDLLPNSEFSLLFNKKIVKPTFDKNPILALRELGVLSKLEHVILESKSKILLPESKIDELDYDFSSNQLRRLWTDSKRNKLIVDTIIKEVEEGRPCIVFTCSVEHSVILSSALNISGVEAKFVDSLQNKSLRRNAIRDFKSGVFDVLLNFGILTTGFDAPRIKSVIITRPTTSIVLYSQMIGRGLRGVRMGGNEQCRVIDIRDNFLDFGPIEEIYEFFKGYWE